MRRKTARTESFWQRSVLVRRGEQCATGKRARAADTAF
ncbi:hypothetical protein CAMGR0001_2273 [Campylobacter gracilis RM3268]|uniref:Uncharacterized protein n=1 Tax=Campylobacter gracilis RM3268 TaxID=553220 RepID=C8PH85_9BACT|nr:hypothetical protein CAMGR0001_2273 [Campylobacter gracilis RM3268]